MTAEDDIRELLRQPEIALARFRELEAKIADQAAIIEELLRRLYGKRSEKQKRKDAPEPEPSSGDPAAEQPKSKERQKGKPKNGHGRGTFPPHLPREETVNDVPPNERRCSTCDKELTFIGEDVSERGHIQPIKISIRRCVSKKYGCPDGHEIKTGDRAPEGLVPRSKWTTETYAYIVTSKFGDHMPLDRLEGILKRQGIDLPKSTMCDMAMVVSDIVALILGQAKREILSERYLQVDETPLRFMTDGNQRHVEQGYLWVWKAGEKLLFEFSQNRDGDHAARFLGNWTGTLQADGYSGYDAVVAANGITRVGCMAHARRKFKEAADQKEPRSKEMLLLMGRLYWIEAALKKRIARRALEPPAAEALILKVRQHRSRAQMSRIDRFGQQLAADSTTLPKSRLGKAVTYLTNQWKMLEVFVDDPKVAIDNNATERAIRPIAIGRKNWLMAGSPRGAQATARLYSIINVCKALAIDPYAYLSDVLEKVSPNAPLEQLTPWAWKRAREPGTATTTT